MISLFLAFSLKKYSKRHYYWLDRATAVRGGDSFNRKKAGKYVAYKQEMVN
ncbi:hypothetical protein SD78_2072 [Bacillus badius]|nr:hypothetical protein SD78_2072 [Bacillus badius]